MSGECMYYRWNAGYYCDLKYNKQGKGDITSYETNHYCWYGRYDNCPLYKNRNGSGGCFLTSACVDAMGLPDDCHELTVLRAFRDGYLSAQPEGKAEICEYYHIAPQIVEAINAKEDAVAVFTRIYHELVLPCVELIEQGKHQEAHSAYKSAVITLKSSYIPA